MVRRTYRATPRFQVKAVHSSRFLLLPYPLLVAVDHGYWVDRQEFIIAYHRPPFPASPVSVGFSWRALICRLLSGRQG